MSGLRKLKRNDGRVNYTAPIDKKENVKFYTEKCGFRIESTERDGNVELARFVAKR